MILVFFFALVAFLVCGGAIVGFLLALYAFRPHELGQVFALLSGSAYERHVPNQAALGLLIAALLPAIAGLSYAVSGTKWFVDLFGEAGTYFWVWVAGAFVIGFLLGLILRGERRNK